MAELEAVPRVLQVLSLNIDTLINSRKYGFLSYSVSQHGYEDLENSGLCEIVIHASKSKTVTKSKIVTALRSLFNQYLILKKVRSFDVLYLSADEHYLLVFLCKYFGIVKKPIVLLNHFTYDYRTTRGILKRSFLCLERKLLTNTVECLLHSSEAIRDNFDNFYANSKTNGEVGFWGASNSFVEKVKEKLEITEKGYMFAPGAANRDFQPVIDACTKLKQPLTILTTSNISSALVYDENYVTVEIFDTNDAEIFEKLWRHYLECTAILIPIGGSNHVPNGASVLAEALLVKKPLIASNSDAVYIDIEENGIGLLVDTSSPEDWREAITQLKDCLIGNDSVGQNFARLAERYNSENLSSILIKKFREVSHEQN